jgi:hypothetical protein
MSLTSSHSFTQTSSNSTRLPPQPRSSIPHTLITNNTSNSTNVIPSKPHSSIPFTIVPNSTAHPMTVMPPRGGGFHHQSNFMTSNQSHSSSSTLPTSLRITHNSYLCPGLHDVGSKSNVQILSFSSLFTPLSHFTIPLFQRRYCWDERQIRLWSSDVIAGKSDHRIGNIIVKKETEDILENDKESLLVSRGWRLNEFEFESEKYGDGLCHHRTGEKREVTYVIIDGQQRITTHLLYLSSLRDVALRLLIQLESTNQTSNEVIGNVEEEKEKMKKDEKKEKVKEEIIHPNLLSRFKDFILHIEEYLYCNVTESNLFISHISNSLSTHSIQWSEIFSSGHRCHFMSLIPSFCDRSEFFTTMIQGKIIGSLCGSRGHFSSSKIDVLRFCENCQKNYCKFEKNDNQKVEQDGTQKIDHENKNKSLIFSAKQIFDEEIVHFLQSRLSENFSFESAIRLLEFLFSSARENLTFALVDILTPINYAQVNYLNFCDSFIFIPIFISVSFFFFFFFFLNTNYYSFCTSHIY